MQLMEYKYTLVRKDGRFYSENCCGTQWQMYDSNPVTPVISHLPSVAENLEITLKLLFTVNIVVSACQNCRVMDDGSHVDNDSQTTGV